MKVTYLQMFHWQPIVLEPPVPSVLVQQLHQPSVQAYRQLYNGVGGDYGWTDRNRMNDESLRRIITDPAIEIHRLSVGQQTAGYCELDERQPDEVQLAYFGLMPKFIGRGLGKYFLDWTLQHAWSRGPRRVWVHTCTGDHPAALPNYLRAGFEVYREEPVERVP
jgi:GNAT superfamily N-acetyltransferase